MSDGKFSIPRDSIPRTWVVCRVGDAGSVQLGRQRSPKDHTGPNMRPYLRAANVFDDHIDISDVKEMNFTPEEFEKFRLREGDILLNEGQSLELVGRPAMFRGEVADCCFQNTLVRFVPAPVLDGKFALKLFQHYMRNGRFQKIARWTTNIAHLGASRFAELEIPLPPLAEQKRIVAKIEELFSELEAGEESLRVARRQLGVYRQSLLKQAFEGKLTRCRKVELVPLRDLIAGLSQGWSPKCELNRTPKPDEWAIIKTTAIQHCRYDDSEAKPLPPPFEPRPSIEIKDGDFLMTRKGPRARAGVSCYVRKTRPLLMVCDTVYRFRCIEEKIHPLYLELALNSPDVLRAIDRQKAGISESGLSLTHTKIGTVEIPVCPLPEQQEIVRLLDEQFDVIERNEREIDGALRQSEALRQAILQKAFTGRLVPQDPSDEPSSVLLARVRTERERSVATSRLERKPAAS